MLTLLQQYFFSISVLILSGIAIIFMFNATLARTLLGRFVGIFIIGSILFYISSIILAKISGGTLLFLALGIVVVLFLINFFFSHN